MSLLNSVLGSIGTGNRTPLPKGPDRASTATPPASKPDSTKLGYSSTTTTATARTTRPPVQNAPSATLKRKLDESSPRNVPDKLPKPATALDPRKPTGQSPAMATASSSKQPPPSRPQSAPSSSKPPPKGSYLDLLNQAKQVQAEKAAAGKQVGMIKHAASAKDRLSKVGRRKKEEEIKAQSKGKGGRVAENGAIKKPGQPSLGKPKGQDSVAYKGTIRPPPSSGNGSKEQPAGKQREDLGYKGTAGLGKPPPKKFGSKPRSARDDRFADEYDSEDSFIVDDDEEEDVGGYGGGRGTAERYRYAEDDSDSDMEAAYEDVEFEERQAERQARLDDEREKALEERLKREKEQRRRAAFERR